jgi:hypothetical protein
VYGAAAGRESGKAGQSLDGKQREENITPSLTAVPAEHHDVELAVAIVHQVAGVAAVKQARRKF